MDTMTQLVLLHHDAAPQPFGPFVTRKLAMQKGLSLYYTGKPCKLGHISEHYVSGACFACKRIKEGYTGIYSRHGRCPIKLEAKKRRHIERTQAIRQTPQGRLHRRNLERQRYLRLTKEKKMASTLRARIFAAIRASSTTKAYKSINLLGCDIPQVKAHIESLWLPGMTWDNWSRTGWHIDHIRPCASFDLTDPEQQRQCFHYTNLQPLWAADNLRKGAKVA